MYLKVLFGQRKDSGAAPEALEVADSYAAEDNDELLSTLLAKHSGNSDFLSLAWFDLTLPTGALAIIQMRLTGAPVIAAAGIKIAEGDA